MNYKVTKVICDKPLDIIYFILLQMNRWLNLFIFLSKMPSSVDFFLSAKVSTEIHGYPYEMSSEHWHVAYEIKASQSIRANEVSWTFSLR